jgi:hypothetical protein
MQPLESSNAKALVLYANYTTRLSYYDDWLDAFSYHDGLRVHSVDICRRGAPNRVREQLRSADFVVLLHSTTGDTTMYLRPLIGVLNERQIPLVAFVGNEVNIASSPIGDKREVLGQIHPEYVATQLLLEAGQYLWGDIVTRAVLPLPHALNPKAFTATKALQDRQIDVGVRSVRYHISLGDTDRNDLYDLFDSDPMRARLRVDISTERLNRHDWAAFLNNCRATVSSEAGSWFLERDDATVKAIQAYAHGATGRALVLNSTGFIRKLGHRVPWRIRTAVRAVLSKGPLRLDDSLLADLDKDDVLNRFFQRPRPDFYGKCISSRHFDAIGTRTVQVLLSGRYNDILQPHHHYIPLDQDLSNLEDVVTQLGDDSLLASVTERSYELVREAHTYRSRLNDLLAVLS